VTLRFDARKGLIVVPTRVWGPRGSVRVFLALDTGASRSLVSRGALALAGYDPIAASDHVQITTASGVEQVPRVTVDRIRALSQERSRFLVLAHALPATAGVDGVLGLDFLRGTRLVIDFRTSTVTLE
jgi:predicted aspartyl protease